MCDIDRHTTMDVLNFMRTQPYEENYRLPMNTEIGRNNLWKGRDSVLKYLTHKLCCILYAGPLSISISNLI